MNHITLALIALFTFSSCSETEQGLQIQLPPGYIEDAEKPQYTLFSAARTEDGVITSSIEVRYSDDWSFSHLSNEMYIELGKKEQIEKIASMLYEDIEVQAQESMYFKNHGDCLYRIFTGRRKDNGVLVTNLSIQFIKDAKLYTFIGNCLTTDFHNNHKEFLNAFESLSL